MSQSGATTTSSSPGSNEFPITPYVVGAVGEAVYQTIQDGLDAANAAGGGIVGVQPGTYIEDLTLYDNTQVVGFCSPGTVNAGSGGNEPVVITGTHTPPTTGFFAFKNVSFTSSGSVISTSSPGIATIQVDSCAVGLISGYLFDLDNWIGEISLLNSLNKFGGNRGINNSTGANVFVYNSECGSFGALSSNLGGTNRFYYSTFNNPIAYLDGSDSQFFHCSFLGGITTAGSCELTGSESKIQNLSGSAITHNSSDAFTLTNSTIDSFTNPSIAGTGAGTLTLEGINFLSNNAIAGTLTLFSGTSYSGTLKTDYTDHGVIVGQGSATNMVATSAGTNGQLLIGATGADPAFASLTSTGSSISFTPGANSLNLETGSSVSTSFPTDSGTATPSSGVLTIAGGTNINTSGAGSTATVNLDAAIELTSVSFDSGTNTLSNYEEGTWTPTLAFGGGSTVIVYSRQTGNYTRVGNVVHIECLISLSNKGSSTGAATITLPITNKASADSYMQCNAYALDLPASHFSVSIVPQSSSTTANINLAGDNVAYINADDTHFNNSSFIRFSGFYLV